MITSKKMGKNYLYYSEDDNKNVRTCEQVVNSWDKAVNYVIEDASKNQNGLREAQLGAIFATRAHWIEVTVWLQLLCLQVREKLKQ